MSAATLQIDQAAVEASVAASWERLVATGAARMGRERWRIGRAIYGAPCPLMWPVEEMDAEELLAECRRRIDGMVERGRAGHWTFDMNRLIALRQAEMALVEITNHRGGNS